MKASYITNPQGVFNTDLLETIDINELQKLIIQVRQKLEKQITSQSPATSKFVQITHLAAEAEAASDLSVKSQKFQEASNLAFKLAIEYENNNLNKVFDLVKTYAYLLQSNKNFTSAIYYLQLAKSAKKDNDIGNQYINCIEAFKLLTENVRNYWRLYPPVLRWDLAYSANQLLVDEELGQKGVVSEIKLWVQMSLSSIKKCRNLISSYRTAKKDYIRTVLMAREVYPDLHNPLDENIDSIRKYGLKIDDINRLLKYAYNINNLPQLRLILYQAIEETLEMMNMGVDVSDPLVITPLGWITNKYPEIAEDCNRILAEIVQEQFANSQLDGEDQTLIDEF